MRTQLQEEGYCILPDVLGPGELSLVRAAIEEAIVETRRRGIATHTDFMDPNEKNVRLYNLPDFNPIFLELLRKPIALEWVREILGPHFIVSSFTANIALPGSGSMNWHSDQSVAVPPPWHEPWAANLIWAVDDVHERNGATRFVPGSHRYRTFAEVPDDLNARSRPFECKAGSVIVMDGRLWHTSGKNVTASERRAMMFAYYVADFIRPQANHDASLSPETKARLDDDARALLAMGPAGNVRIGGNIVKLADKDRIDAMAQYAKK